jgi:predicted nucleic acid-binding protein
VSSSIEACSTQKAIDVFERYDDQQLSFTDATTVALTSKNEIDPLLSFDDDFDGLVERLDPGEL